MLPADTITAAVAGDRAALNELCAELRPAMNGWVKRSLGTKFLDPMIDAEDVLQEAQIRLYRRAGSLRSRDPGSLVAWARRLTQREASRAIDRRGGSRAAAGDLDRIPSAPGARSFRASRLREDLRGIPRPARRAALLRARGLGTDEIARRLRRSRRWVQDALRKIREGAPVSRQPSLARLRRGRSSDSSTATGRPIARLPARSSNRSW